jgi:hypothetical protein
MPKAITPIVIPALGVIAFANSHLALAIWH